MASPREELLAWVQHCQELLAWVQHCLSLTPQDLRLNGPGVERALRALEMLATVSNKYWCAEALAILRGEGK